MIKDDEDVTLLTGGTFTSRGAWLWVFSLLYRDDDDKLVKALLLVAAVVPCWAEEEEGHASPKRWDALENPIFPLFASTIVLPSYKTVLLQFSLPQSTP